MRELNPITREWIYHQIRLQLKTEFMLISSQVGDKNMELQWLTLIEVLKNHHDLSIMVTPNTLAFILKRLLTGSFSPKLTTKLIELSEHLSQAYSNAKANIPYEYNLKLHEVIDMAQQGLVFKANRQVFTNVNY